MRAGRAREAEAGLTSCGRTDEPPTWRLYLGAFKGHGPPSGPYILKYPKISKSPRSIGDLIDSRLKGGSAARALRIKLPPHVRRERALWKPEIELPQVAGARRARSGVARRARNLRALPRACSGHGPQSGPLSREPVTLLVPG